MAASQSSNDVPVELVINGLSITKEEVIVEELCKSFFPKTKNIGPTQQDTINKVLIKEIAKNRNANDFSN